MLFRLVSLALAVNLVSFAAAHAKGCPNGLADAKDRIANISRTMASSIDYVERVPPGEVTYIETELKEAGTQRDQERLSIVQGHPFYRAHQVAVEHRRLAEHLARVEQQSQRKRVASLLADALMDYSDLYEAFDKYLDFDASRPQRTVPANVRKDITNNLIGTRYALHNALRCEILVLKDR